MEERGGKSGSWERREAVGKWLGGGMILKAGRDVRARPRGGEWWNGGQRGEARERGLR